MSSEGSKFSKELSEVFAEKLPEVGEVSRFRCECAYDGTDFCGWQSQKGGGSVQDYIECRLEKIFKKFVRIHGSGRTDAGVHATGQVFHFDAVWKHSQEALLAALRSTNRTDVRIRSLKKTDKKFHARYGANGKCYVYYMHLGTALPHLARYRWSLKTLQPDVTKMNEAAAILVGTHDFTAFSASRGANVKENPIKTIKKLTITKHGAELRLEVVGSGFMYKMVRMITGALVDVGIGKLTCAQIKEVLDSGKRGNHFHAAPACGLFLRRVYF